MKQYKIITLIAIALIIVAWVLARPYHISGDCMEPAIKNGKLYFLNRLLPFLRKYQIGDIIVFKHEGKDWISRIVALENDIIQISESSIVVNGTTLSEVGVRRNWSGWKQGTYAIDKPFQVPLAHVFVLSDTLSAQHDDSRVFGPVSEKSILGGIW